jgi:RNA polymerase sigma factor (sigma-70 family)
MSAKPSENLFVTQEDPEPDNPILYFSSSHWRRTYGHAYSIAGNPADAEDIAQETYVRLFETFVTGRRIDSCVAWIRGVMRRVVVDHFREARPDLHLALVDADSYGDDNRGRIVADIVDSSASIEERLAEKSLAEESLRILATLPDRDRECVLMYARGYKFVQIAKALGMPYEVAIETTRKALVKAKRGITRAGSLKTESRREKMASTVCGRRPGQAGMPEPISTTELRPIVSRPTQAISDEQDRYSFGEIVVDVPARRVLRRGQPLELSSKEFELLTYFLRHPCQILSRDRLLQEVWGYTRFSETRTLDTHIARLREKVEPEAKHPQFVMTVRGVGYRFVF